jgi:hypothetical protein
MDSEKPAGAAYGKRAHGNHVSGRYGATDVCSRLQNVHRRQVVQTEKGDEVMQQMTLCGKCAELMREQFLVKTVSRGINNKIDCQNCKRRRYGGTFAVEAKKKAGKA